MMRRHRFAALLLLPLLAACASQAVVSDADVRIQTSGAVPGKFAGYVQSGGWNLKAEIQGMNCGIWSFEADINTVHTTAMTKALRQAIGDVTLLDQPMKPDQLVAAGYDGQIAIVQGPANATTVIQNGLFSATGYATLTLDAYVAVSDPSGQRGQQPVTAEVKKQDTIFMCPDVSPIMATAAQEAIGRIAEQAAIAARQMLLNRAATQVPAAAS